MKPSLISSSSSSSSSATFSPVLLSSGFPILQPMLNRSIGDHVSDAVKYLCIKLGYLDGDKRLSSTWAQFGVAWEWALINQYRLEYPGEYFQPGEVELENVYGTPDLIKRADLKSGRKKKLVEIKLSWMSSNTSPTSTKFWRYWVQAKAYCYQMDIADSELIVCHVNGDYKGDGPVVNTWGSSFSDMDLISNWSMLKKAFQDKKKMFDTIEQYEKGERIQL